MKFDDDCEKKKKNITQDIYRASGWSNLEKARLAFAKAFIDMAQSFWDNVLRTDETKV